MSKTEKLLKKIENNPVDVPFKQLKKLLELHGYEAKNSGGSHWVFRKNEKISITIPYKRPIKIIYVKKVLEILKDSK